MPNYTLPTSGFSEGPELGPPSTLRDVWDSSVRAQRDIANPLARERVLDEEYDRRIRDVETATGIRLFHPGRNLPTVDDYREAQDDPVLGQGSAGLGAAGAVSERRFHRELQRLAEQHPDKAAAIRPDVTVWDDAYARVRKAETDSESAVRRSPLALDVPVLGPVDPIALAGSFWGWAHDPVNLATSVIGPAGSAAKGILWNASRQAVAGMMQQAAVEPFAQAWRKEAGLDFGWGQAAQNVAFAGLFGGAVDAGGRTLNRTLRGKPLAGTPETPRPLPDAANDAAAPPSVHAPEAATNVRGEALDDALEAAARRLPEDSPVRRAAEGDAAATIALVEKLGPHSDDAAAVRGALDQVRMETLQEASIAEALQAADVEDRLAAHIRHVAEPDANPPAGAPIVHAPAAAETIPSGLPHAGSPVDPAVLTALREGELAPIDAAALIRERPDLAGEISPATETGRGIHALSRLSETGFAHVVDGAVPAEWAAIIADAAPPARHADLIERLVRAAPRDTPAARRLIAEMLQAPTDAATAARILGGHDAAPGARGAVSAPEGATQRVRAPEFDEPVGDGAKVQADSLKPIADRQKGIEDLKAALRSVDPRKARGMAMGFDTNQVWFHGTGGKFEAFDAGRAGSSLDEGWLGRGVYMSSDPKVADYYSSAGRSGLGDPSILPLHVRGQFYDYGLKNRGTRGEVFGIASLPSDIREAVLRRADFKLTEEPDFSQEPKLARAMRDELIERGFDGVRASFPDGKAELVVFDPTNIRSVNAAFDPTKGDSAHLMARLADGGGLGDTAYSPAFNAAERAIAGDLQAQAVKTLPPAVRLEVERRIEVGNYDLDGYFDRRNNIVAVALDSGNPDFTFNHERIHALRAHGLFTAGEWSLLVEQANARGMRQEMGRDLLAAYREQLTPAMVTDLLVERGVPSARDAPWPELRDLLVKQKMLDLDDVQGSLERSGLWDEARLQAKIDEEAVAFLAEAYRGGEKLPGRVEALMQRMTEFLERVRNVLAGHGFNTLDDVFQRIESGEVAMRTPREVTLPGGAKISGIHLRGASDADIASALFAIRAFHGTPHDFERFDMAAIGTGEGTQAYGHGLYFAEHFGVALQYQRKLSGQSAVEAAAQELAESHGRTWSDMGSYERQAYIDQAEQEGLVSARAPKGHLYEVRINADPSDFLDWDKPLSQQSEKVRGALQKRFADDPVRSRDLKDDVIPAYLMRNAHGPETTDALRDAGIPGIRYLDGGSRTAGEGSHNFVVFDDKLIEIVAKNGEPVSPPWVREIGDVLKDADADADAGMLVQACKLF